MKWNEVKVNLFSLVRERVAQFFPAIFIIVLLINLSAWAGKITKRKIELEWESQANAANYEVEIYDAEGTKLVKSQTMKDPVFVTTLPIGQFKFRSRYSTTAGEQSLWSEMESLEVIVPEGKLNLEGTGFYSRVDLTTGTASLNLNWDPIPNIKSYKIEIFDKTGKLAFSQINPSAPFSVKLREGEYQYAVTPIDEYGNLGEPSEKSPPITISKAKLPPPKLSLSGSNKFFGDMKQEMMGEPPESSPFDGENQLVDSVKNLSWEVHPGAKLEGTLFFRRIFASEWVEIPLKEQILKSPWYPPGDLLPGEYQLVVQSIVDGTEPSDPKYVFFRVKPKREAYLLK